VKANARNVSPPPRHPAQRSRSRTRSGCPSARGCPIKERTESCWSAPRRAQRCPSESVAPATIRLVLRVRASDRPRRGPAASAARRRNWPYAALRWKAYRLAWGAQYKRILRHLDPYRSTALRSRLLTTLHTAALALAAGWLLLKPPLGGGGRAPLNQWTVYHPVSSKNTTFESEAACLAGMDALRHPPPASQHNSGSAKGVQPTTSFDHLICVPADDSRLKR